MTDPRLSEHLTRFLGELTDSERPGDDIELRRYERSEFVTFTTAGLSTLPITAVYPQELVCSVQPGQDGAARYVVQATLDLILAARRGVVDGQVMTNDQPLLAQTEITAVLVGSHPYLDDDFNIVFNDQRNVLAELMTLIPITSPEANRAQELGLDALLDRFETANPPLLDVTRRST